MNESSKKKRRFLWAAIPGVLILGAAVSLFLSACGLQVSRYSIVSPKLTESIRIVQLTDLHNSEFGRGNRRLIEKTAAQEPDLILITGDLLDQSSDRTDIAEALIRGLAEIAPVYVSYGNHEAAAERLYGLYLRELYTAAGAVVLEYDWLDVTVNGQDLRLGGIYGYCLPARYTDNGEGWPKESDYVTAFQDTDVLKLLMCHMPVCWLRSGGLDAWDVDLVFAGHTHGGQIRFPWIGGLWAPDVGWFPGREAGLYFSKDETKVLILSKGLGSTEKVPRFNNMPEITVVDLIPG